MSQSAHAARVQAIRHVRKAALLEQHGSVCRCGSPAECFVRRRGRPTRSRACLDEGPSDRGLTSRMALIEQAMVGRVPMCRPCQLSVASRRSVAARRASGRPEAPSSRELKGDGKRMPSRAAR